RRPAALIPTRFLRPRSRPPPLRHPSPTRRSSDLLRCGHCAPRPVGQNCGLAFIERVRHGVNDFTIHQQGQVTYPADPDRGHLQRSEEHTSELQSQSNLVCRLLLEKKKTQKNPRTY